MPHLAPSLGIFTDIVGDSVGNRRIFPESRGIKGIPRDISYLPGRKAAFDYILHDYCPIPGKFSSYYLIFSSSCPFDRHFYPHLHEFTEICRDLIVKQLWWTNISIFTLKFKRIVSRLWWTLLHLLRFTLNIALLGPELAPEQAFVDRFACICW